MLQENKIRNLKSSDRFIDDIIREAAQTWLSKKENKKNIGKYEVREKYQETKKDELTYLPKESL